MKLVVTERNIKVPVCIFGLSRDGYASYIISLMGP